MALPSPSFGELLDRTTPRGLQADHSKAMAYRPEEGRFVVRGARFVVISRYGKAHLTGPLLAAPHLPKPFQPEALVRAVRALAHARH
jgi:hypothetical protein